MFIPSLEQQILQKRLQVATLEKKRILRYTQDLREKKHVFNQYALLLRDRRRLWGKITFLGMSHWLPLYAIS